MITFRLNSIRTVQLDPELGVLYSESPGFAGEISTAIMTDPIPAGNVFGMEGADGAAIMNDPMAFFFWLKRNYQEVEVIEGELPPLPEIPEGSIS